MSAQFKYDYGNHECEICFPGTSTNGSFASDSASDCLCPAGTFTRPIPASDGDPCDPCPRGGLCPDIGMHLPDILNLPGFWRGTLATALPGCVMGACIG